MGRVCHICSDCVELYHLRGEPLKIVADKDIPFIENYFSDHELILKPGRSINTTDVKNADILLVRSVTKVDQDLLANSKIKFVGSVTAGSDHLETKWLEQQGIAWSLAAGFNAPPVADYVVSMVAALQRRHLLKTHGNKAAVIGVGSVGKLVAQHLKALNFEVVLCDPIRAEQEKNFTATALQNIVNVDLISLHVPLRKEGAHPTYHFIDEAFLKRQKPGCILLNASRGAVIDEAQLGAHGKHLVWCLDVWENEPTINQAILQQALITTPHIAGYSVQSKMRGMAMMYVAMCEKNIIQYTSKTPLDMPQQTLAFAGQQHHWQDIVLGIFNPLVLTAMMKAQLLSGNKVGETFDAMRQQFNYRHELAFTKIQALDLLEEDKKCLQALGVEIIPAVNTYT